MSASWTPWPNAWRGRGLPALKRKTPMSELEATVMNLPRRDASDKLRGRTRYTNDRARPDMLHAVLLRAAVPAGRIRKLDMSAALACPGVRAVATGADAPGLYGIGIADHPLLAIDTIRYHGEPIAVVAARNVRAGTRGAFSHRARNRTAGAGADHGRSLASRRPPRARRMARLRGSEGRRRAVRQHRLGG